MFVLVFGFSVVFSSVIVSAEDVQLYSAELLSADGSYYQSDINGQWVRNINSFQKPLDGTNVANEVPITLSSDYHAPSLVGRAYLLDSFNFLSLDDVGYTSSMVMTQYNTSASADSKQYYVVNRVKWQNRIGSHFINGVFVNNQSEIFINLKVDGDWSSVGAHVPFKFTYSGTTSPVLKAGVKYNLSGYVVGATSKDTFTWNAAFGAIPINNGYFSADFTLSSDLNLGDNSDGQYTFFTCYDSSGVDLQVQSLVISAVYDDSDVVDAINNQTDDINKNHDETMDKIDDVTDFDNTEQGQMSGDVDDVKNSFNEKMGILSFADSIFDQFFGLFETDNKKPGLVLPAFSIEVQNTLYTVWDEQTFDLSQLDGWFSGLMTAVRFATSFLIYAALIMYIQKIFSAIVQDWSDR